MGTREVTGVVKMLGNSTVHNLNYMRYSLIEFEDGSIVDSVLVSKRMDNFLERSLKGNVKTTLWLRGSRLVGLIVDSKAYVDREGYQPIAMSIIFILIGLGLCIYVIGIQIVWVNMINYQHARAISKFQQSNPTAVVL